MKKSKLLIASLVAAMLAIAVPMVSAQGNGIQYQETAGMVRLTTDEIEMKVTGVGEVPHFHWWDPDSPGTDYHLIFVKLFEANDTDSDGVYNGSEDQIVGSPFALPSTGWDFSGFETETDDGNVTAVHFNFTSTTEHDPRSGGETGNIPGMASFDVKVQLRVHMDVENSNELKFDVIIDGWNWTYDDSILVLQFTISESSHGEEQGSRDPSDFGRTGNQFQFNGAYMEYAETARAAQNTLEVRASYGDSAGQQAGNAIYLAFEYFGNETLEYDPTLGIGSDGVLPSDNTMLLLIGGGIVVVVVIALIVKFRG
ncbi:hypothetical protein EU537_08705 [Candidatus Thorarchaeota archaeon]|nr:MAG: hypothetical protein EU537_08705 [Candidatus Thorarchaeota archaeon]